MAPEPSDQRPFSTRLNDTIFKHLGDESFGVSELVSAMGMSHSTLRRKVMILAGTSISQYICRLRLEKAVEMLGTDSVTVSEVAFACGFQSVSYFVRCFKDKYGSTPGQIRKLPADDSADERKTLKTHIGNPGRRQVLMIVAAMFILLSLTMSFLFIFDSLAVRDQSPVVSVAVLPFRNESPEEHEMYFINGTMEAIRSHLDQIEEIRVPSRTTVEQYRNTAMPINQIAEDLKVSYVLEGSGQKRGNRIRFTFSLVDAVNDHRIWSNYYDKEIHTAEEIFEMQSDVAQQVAKNIEVVIKPEEKEKIERIPTKNLSAYYFYQMGREEHNKYLYLFDYDAINDARRFYYKALEFDSSFAAPYCWLGYTWLHRRTRLEDLYEEPSDSALILANIALSLDDRCAEAYHVRGWYYWQAGDNSRALLECSRAEKLDPDYFYLYLLKAWCYWHTDRIKAADCFRKMLPYADGFAIPKVYRYLGHLYRTAGFQQQSDNYFREAFTLDGDSVEFYNGLALAAFTDNHFTKAIELGLKGYACDSLDPAILEILGFSYMFNRQPEQAAEYFGKCLDNPENLRERYYLILGPAGYCYWMTGNKEQAEMLFNEQIRHANRIIEKDLPFEKQESYKRLAAVYSIRGDTAKAMGYLRSIIREPQLVNIRSTMISHDPSFDNIRDHPEFQRIQSEVVNRFRQEHAMIRDSFQDQ